MKRDPNKTQNEEENAQNGAAQRLKRPPVELLRAAEVPERDNKVEKEGRDERVAKGDDRAGNADYKKEKKANEMRGERPRRRRTNRAKFFNRHRVEFGLEGEAERRLAVVKIAAADHGS